MPSPEASIQLASDQRTASKTAYSVLIVDDDALILSALSMELQREGYLVFKAQSGQEGLLILDHHPIALIICDQKMPVMDGLEFLRKAQKIQPNAIRVALTGSHDSETIIRAINEGQISQFLSKPWDTSTLRQTVALLLEKYRLYEENQNLQELLIHQNQKLEVANKILRYEMRLSSLVHKELLLGKVPVNVPGLSIAATTIPSKEVDGDFFDFYNPLPHIIDVVIGDVMGKGMPAALVGTAIKTQLLRFATPINRIKYCDKNTFWLNDLCTPYDVLSRAHNEIAPQLIELEFFVTLFYSRFDLEKKVFSYVDCGSTKPIHYKAKTGEFVFLKGCDFPIGMVEQNDYHQFDVPFEANDLFIFYSDGLTESRSPLEELFGMDRLTSVITKNVDNTAQDILHKIRDAVLQHTCKKGFDDDLTLLVIKTADSDHYKPQEELSGSYLNDFSQLQAVRSFIKRICGNSPGDTEALYQALELVTDEAFCNIVKHAYENIPGQTIYLRAQYQDEGLWLEFSDQGNSFNPESTAEPSLIGDREGGYGLFLIRQLTDKLTYHPKSSLSDRNYLRIYKRYIFREAPMEFTHQTQNLVLVITPTGPSLDAREAHEFKDKALQLINQNDSHAIVVDMQNLQFIDSSGLGVFLSILKTLHAQHGEMKLANLNKSIQTIFELVSMHKIFEIYNTVEEAIHSFK